MHIMASFLPLTNNATVFGLLLFTLFVIFKSSKSEVPFLKKFYSVVPPLLLCYFVPAIFNSTGIISANDSKDLYYVASRYFLPASLVLLCLSIDLKSILKLGPKALIMFFTATFGVVIGGPIALFLVSRFVPELLGGQGPEAIWRGLSTVAGSWIGGGANQTAMKEIYGASDSLFSAMIVVDTFVLNAFMSVLLFMASKTKKIDKWLNSDTSSIDFLKKKMENFHSQTVKIPSYMDLMTLVGITFLLVGLGHLLADYIAPVLDSVISSKINLDPDSNAYLFVSLGSKFFWLIVMVTIFGVVLSFTKYRKLEGVGASNFGTIFLYILIVTIGMKMDIVELINGWAKFKFLILVGIIWASIHFIVLFAVAKLIRAPFFFVAVGSQANLGGAASAPVVASAFGASLAPVGVLLAVLGYAVGTFGAIICTTLMQLVSNL